MVDAAVLQDLIWISFPLVIGVVSLIFYFPKHKSGMLIIAIAFFLQATTQILFGATMMQYFFYSGLGVSTYALYALLLGMGSKIMFTILIIIGLLLLNRETK